MKFEYAVCNMNYSYNDISERGEYTVDKPIQLFTNLDDAEAACVVMQPFYGYDLRVIHVDELHERFR